MRFVRSAGRRRFNGRRRVSAGGRGRVVARSRGGFSRLYYDIQLKPKRFHQPKVVHRVPARAVRRHAPRSLTFWFTTAVLLLIALLLLSH